MTVNERGQRRLEIARRLRNLPDETDMIEYLYGLSDDNKARLKGCVDFVEDMERHEQKGGARYGA